MSEKDIEQQEFAEKVYRVLRDYQDGKIENTQISVGKLDDKLTVVYDAVIAAHSDNSGIAALTDERDRLLSMIAYALDALDNPCAIKTILFDARSGKIMITDSMKAFGIIFGNTFKKLKDNGMPENAALHFATVDAQSVFPLNDAEKCRVKELAETGRLSDLISEK